MKTSININLYGTVYSIDQDAHQLLEQYINNLKSYFSHQAGGDEICDDLEHRVAELFWEYKEQGTESITIEQVKEVMQKIGNPEQMDNNADTGNSTNENAEDQTNADSNTTGSAPSSNGIYGQDNDNNQGKSRRGQRRFMRDPQDKLVGGVISGATHYFGGNDPLVWRLATAVITFFFFSYIGIFVLGAYLLLWVIAPEARTAEDRLRMKGQEVNPDSISTELLNVHNQTVSPKQNNGCLSSLVSGIAILFKAILIVLTAGCCIPFLVLLIGLIVSQFCLPVILNDLPFISSDLSSFVGTEKWMIGLEVLAIIVIIALPIFGLYRMLRSGKLTPLSNTTTIILWVLWVAALVFGIGNAARMVSKAANENIHLDWDMNDFGYEANGEETTLTSPDSIQFSSVCMKGVGTIIYQQGDTCSYRAEGEEVLVNNTEFNVIEGELTISQKSELHLKQNNGINIYITSPYLTRVNLKGVGELTSSDTIRQDMPIELALDGVGEMVFNYIESPAVEVKQKGVGSCEINVKTDNLKVESKGIGEITVKGEANHYVKKETKFVSHIEDDELKTNN